MSGVASGRMLRKLLFTDQKDRKGCDAGRTVGSFGARLCPGKRNSIFQYLAKVASHLRQPRLWYNGIAAGGSPSIELLVTVHLTRISRFFQSLRHADHGIVDGAVTVRVEFHAMFPDRRQTCGSPWSQCCRVFIE